MSAGRGASRMSGTQPNETRIRAARIVHDKVFLELSAQLPEMRGGIDALGTASYLLDAPGGGQREVTVRASLLAGRTVEELVEQVGKEFQKAGLAHRSVSGWQPLIEEVVTAPPTPGEVADSYRRATYVNPGGEQAAVPVWIVEGLRIDGGKLVLRVEMRDGAGRPEMVVNPEDVDLEFGPDHGPLSRDARSARLRAALHALHDAVAEAREDADLVEIWGLPKDDRSDEAQQYADRQVRGAGLRLLRQRGDEVREAFELFDAMMKRVEEEVE